jgi:hypothetical protein
MEINAMAALTSPVAGTGKTADTLLGKINAGNRSLLKNNHA